MSDIPPLVIGPLSSSGPKLISKDQWISDEFVTSCQLCKTPFTTFFRRVNNKKNLSKSILFFFFSIF